VPRCEPPDVLITKETTPSATAFEQIAGHDPRQLSPRCTMAFMPPSRMGSLPRSFAAEAHGCFMVRILSGSTECKVAAQRPRPMASSPSDRSTAGKGNMP
jgi:hypothetical protein